MSKSRKKDKKNSSESLEISELGSAVSELTKNVTAMQEMLQNMLISKEKVENKKVSNDEVSSREIRQASNNNRNYISLWKDLGGNNNVFSPGGSTHPVDFIKKLTQALEDAEVPDHKKVDLAVNCLRGSALTWAMAKRNKFDTFSEFSSSFMQRYWDSEDERKTFRRIEYGSYENGSRADYFLRLVNENNYLSQPLTEREIVKILIKHFDHNIRRGIINNGIDEVDEVERYLRELDEMDRAEDNRDRNRNFNRTGFNNRVDNRGNNRNREIPRENNHNNQRVAERDETVNLINLTSENKQNADLELNEIQEVPTFCKESEDLLSDNETIQKNITKLQWPLISIVVHDVSVNALIDTGSQYNCISEAFLQKVSMQKKNIPMLPMTGLCIKGAIGKKSQRISSQVLIEFTKNDYEMEALCLVVPHLACDLILGCDWLVTYKGMLDFNNFKITLTVIEEPITVDFVLEEGCPIVLSISDEEGDDIRINFTRPTLNISSEENRLEIVKNAIMFTENEKKELVQVLNKHKQIFSDQPGLIKGYEHVIELRDKTPFCLKSYPIPYIYREAAREQIREMIKWGVVELAKTEYISPMIVVEKKDKSPRICLDARFLNSRMVKDHVIPPNPNEMFEFSGMKYLSTIDLTASYWQILIRDDCRKYTGFQFEGQTYQFRVLPFGLSTSVASFIRALSLIVGNLDFVIPYVDDILIYSASAEEHLYHLDLLFEFLESAGVTVKIRKCEFARDKVKFLGHVLTPTGIHIDMERVSAIQNFPRPLNIRHLRSFLGTCNFDRRFVSNFSDLLLPLTKLLRKGCRWKWSDDEEKAFHQIKEAYLKVTFLRHPELDKRFFIQCDSSGYGVGACLFQINEMTNDKNIVAFTSRTLRGSELNYSVTEKEALAILNALKQWRIFVLGRPLTIITDHKALSFLLKCRSLNSRLLRWTLYLQEYSFDIIHCKGKDNILADCLSRYPVDMDPRQVEPSKSEVIEIFSIKHCEAFNMATKNIKKISEDQQRDSFCNKIITSLKSVDCRTSILKWYTVKDDILYRRGDSDEEEQGLRLCIPKNHILALVQQEHEERGHFGANKSYLALRKYYFWPKMKTSIRHIVSGCISCQQVKISCRLHGEMHSVIVDGPNKLVCLDLMGPLPRSRAGCTQLLVVLDSFSKLVSLYPLRRATTLAIFKRLKNDYFEKIAKPEMILTDNGTQFSKRWKTLLAAENVKAIHTSNYYPQGNNTERINREIGRLLRHLCHQSHTKWAYELKRVENWLNEVIHENTGFTPREVHFAKIRDEPLVKKLGLPLQTIDKGVVITLAHERLMSKADRRKQRHAKKYKCTKLKVGDLVWVRSHPQSSAENAKIKKFFLLFEGPYSILKSAGPNSFEVANEGKFHSVQNIVNLKKYVSPCTQVEINT